MKRTNSRHVRQKATKDQEECYVLITCDKPAADGKMQVKMTYGGDAILASYLLQGAQSLMDEHVEEELTGHSENLRLVE